MKNFFKNRKGMTYVELLVAFTLLVLIVFVFSPMLLSSYSTIYEAGAREEDAYNAKSQIETNLATRTARDLYKNFTIQFKKNAQNVVAAVQVSGQKITTPVLQTLFYNGRPRLTLISGPVIDNNSYHNIAVYTENLHFSAEKVKETDAAPTTLDDDAIKIQVKAPNKAMDGMSEGSTPQQYVESNVDSAYNIRIPVTNITADPEGGIISIDIGNFDFTATPIRLRIYYKSEVGKIEYVEDYIDIELPTLILGGETASGADYYTTAGVLSKNESVEDGGNVYIESSLSPVEARSMSCGNGKGAGVVTQPSALKINDKAVKLLSISYISDNLELNKGLKPFYVFTGTNGAIYRTYGFTNRDAFVGGPGFDNYSQYTKEHYFAVKGVNQSYAKTYYPTFWSGDSTHQFVFSTYAKDSKNNKVEYAEGCWTSENSGNTFSGQAQMSYFNDPTNSQEDERIYRRRTISYILTESGYALRFAGYSSSFKNANRQESSYIGWWEANNNSKNYMDKASATSTNKNFDKTSCKVYRWLDVYNEGNWRFDRIASLAVVSMNNFSLAEAINDDYNFSNALLSDKDPKNDNDIPKYAGKYANIIEEGNDNAKLINVTSACYIPQLNSNKGAVLYLGNTNLYMTVSQLDSCNKTNGYAEEYKNGLIKSTVTNPAGAFTTYLMCGTPNSNGTIIAKNSASGVDSTDSLFFDKNGYTGCVMSLAHFIHTEDEAKSHNTIDTMDKSNKFFVDRTVGTNENKSTYAFLKNVSCTLGYSSDRNFVYSDIVFNRDANFEAYKSYERCYFKSHYGYEKTYSNLNYTTRDETVGDKKYKNSYDNDYYNVWFPGETYNLTKTATLNGITVAVGYSLAGSVYQYVQASDKKNNTSTALGGVFNDGVLAVCTSKDTHFNNLLYFKDNNTMDTTYLSSTNSGTYGTAAYGTHARQSVRFTAVDLGTLASGTGESFKENYYAYYGDSTGRVFYSKIASETNKKDKINPDNPDPDINLTVVDYVADLTAADSIKNASNAGKMIEIKLNGESLNKEFSEIVDVAVISSAATGGETDTSGASVTYDKAKNFDLVIISGKKEGTNSNFVVVAKIGANTDGVPTQIECKKITFDAVPAGTSIQINDSICVNGYYYAVGVTGAGNGFLLAVDEASLKDLDTSKSYFTDTCQKVAYTAASESAPAKSSITNVKMKPLYSIGGRSA